MTNPKPIEHDFEAALSAFNEKYPAPANGNPRYWSAEKEATRTALKLAIRLQNGDVSEGMRHAGHDAMLLATLSNDVSGKNKPTIKLYQTMSQKMLEEINDGTE